jgi:hypothetical protein
MQEKSSHKDEGLGPFDNVSHFRYLGTTVTNKNLFQEEIKKSLNSGNA